MRAPSGTKPVSGEWQAQSGAMLLWIGGLVCGVAAALAVPTALLMVVLLAPTLVALAIEPVPGRPFARAMLLCGLAASVFPVRTLWDQGHSLQASLALAADPSTLGVAWSAAGVGWLLCEFAPVLVRVVLESASLSRAARLRAARARLEEEWGFDPG